MPHIFRLVAANGVEVGVRKITAIGEHNIERLDTVALALHVMIAMQILDRLW
jgi:hypothetical protein